MSFGEVYRFILYYHHQKSMHTLLPGRTKKTHNGNDIQIQKKNPFILCCFFFFNSDSFFLVYYSLIINSFFPQY